MERRDDDARQQHSALPPPHVRAIDAFSAFYQQVGVVGARIAEVETAFEMKAPATVVLAMADLNFAWSILDARLELLEAVTNDDAGRELWTLPAMQLIRDASRKALSQGVTYAARHEASESALVVQLHQLAVRLTMHEQVASVVSGHRPPTPEPPIRVYVIGSLRRRLRRHHRRCGARSRRSW